jgi:pimeloyl-ACP methyl ester carboxylesterase
MTTFVLVHGGWHGAWCWERVVPFLTAAGHAVATPTLAGLGDRVAEATPDTSIGVHAADIAAAIRAAQRPVVLVAHSYAGAPAEVAAAQMPERLARIVHLDSFALDDGEAVIDVFPPPIREAVLAQVEATGHGWKVDPLPPALLGLQDPHHVAAVMPRLTPQPLRTMTERVHVPGGAQDVPRTYVECLTGADTKPFGFYAARARERGWDSRTIDTGHDVMITDPQALAGLLLDVATSTHMAAGASST